MILGPKFSVIIPVFNEEKNIRACLAGVRCICGDAQVIVVDGGSEDKTVDVARLDSVTLETSRRGRGIQCNAGARIARGDIYVFLHADTKLSERAFEVLRETFADDRVNVAKFRLRFDSASVLLRLASFFTRFDCILTSFGDQGIAVRRRFFEEMGGFPDWPVFEDVHFFRLARRKTRVVCLSAVVTTSSRRFRKRGVWRQMAGNGLLIIKYLCGCPAAELARQYEEGAIT